MPDGIGLRLNRSWGNILWTTITAAIGLVALAAGFTGWLKVATTKLERLLLIAAGLVLVYPNVIEDIIGIGLFAIAAWLQYRRRE